MKRSVQLTALAVGLVFTVTSYAAVSYDQNGVGFVGKGDVQNIYDWNNAMLQDNAHLVDFRMLLKGSAATWKCSGVNPAGHTVTETHSTDSAGVTSAVNFDARKNRVGQITGFLLRGIGAGSTTLSGIGECPPKGHNWQQQPTLVPDSIIYEPSEEPLLQVSLTDGALAGVWHDLPITE